MTGPAGRSIVPVAAAVLLRADGAVLLADRPTGKPYAGYWEFPGGKIEPGESAEHALARELAEELHIEVVESMPWLVFEFDYPHAYVRLHFRRVYEWRGKPAPLEGQRLIFYRTAEPAPQPLLPAAVPVLSFLRLPERLSWPGEQAMPVAGEVREVRIGGAVWRAAACRDAAELQAAAASGADFALAGAPPDAELADLCRATPIPVYAPDPGGQDALERVRRLGAHGLVRGPLASRNR